MENAYKFGFILRYPQKKTDITGFPYEPWHYRYVGQPHASFIKKNNFTLEEYIAYLKKHGEITTTFNETRYSIYYLSDKGDTIEIPQGYSYSVSLDNTGGVIVTTF
jgi:D-alanyl-D-alanine carboxypeptidase